MINTGCTLRGLYVRRWDCGRIHLVYSWAQIILITTARGARRIDTTAYLSHVSQRTKHSCCMCCLQSVASIS